MSLQQWALVWKVVLIAGISLFTILAVVVSVGGFFDIGRLFRTLRQTHGEENKPPEKSAGER